MSVPYAETIGRALLAALQDSPPDPADPAALRALLQAGARAAASDVADLLHAEADRQLLIAPRRALAIAAGIQQLGALSEQPGIEALGAMARADAVRELGRYAEALAEYDRAGRLFLSVHDEVGWARSRLGAAATRAYTVELGPALAEAERARSILQARGLWLRVARLETAMGNLLVQLGRNDEALAAHARAAEAAAHIPESEARALTQAQIQVNAAAVYQRLDQYQRADEMLRSASDTFCAHGRVALVCVADGNRARGLVAQGHVSRALALATHVRDACLQLGRMSHAAIFGQVAVECLLELNRPNEAAELANEVVAQLEASDAGVELARGLLQRATVRRRLGAFAEAAGDLARARALFAEGGCANWAAIAALQHAHALEGVGAWVEALEEAREVGRLLRRRGLLVAAARADLLRARVLSRLGQGPAARLAAGLARAAGRRFGVPLLEYQASRVLGETAPNERQALRAYTAAARALERSQGRILTEQRSGFLQHEHKLAVFDAAIELSLRAGDARQAFRFAERAKARALTDALALRARGIAARAQTPAAQALADDLARLRQRYDRLSSTLFEPRPQDEAAGPTAAGRTDLVQAELDQLQSRITAVLDQLRLADAASLDQLAELQGKLRSPLRSLGRRTALVQFQVLGDRVLVFVLRSGHRVQVRSTPAGTLEELVRLRRLLDLNIRTALRGHGQASLEQQARALLQRIHARLLQPVEPLLDGCQRVVIVPHGALHAFPFAALFDGERYLIERFELALAPSATSTAFCRRERPSHAATGALVIAESADGRLPGALAEGEAVAQLLQATRLFETDATVERTRALMQEATIVHMAAHGQARADAPLFSHLRLANGQMMAADCLDLALDCELVTLSACESGQAVVAAGDEPIGLTRSLLYAGARSVIQSLWRVDDAATRELMVRVYAHLRQGTGRAEALRVAQRAFVSGAAAAAGWSHPAFWAAFALVGDWRPLQLRHD